MSLSIDTNAVTRVLLADGWHDVANESFDLDAYEFMWSGDDLRLSEMPSDRRVQIVHRGGQSGVCDTGFSFRQADGSTISGPLTAVLAVETDTAKRTQRP